MLPKKYQLFLSVASLPSVDTLTLKKIIESYADAVVVSFGKLFVYYKVSTEDGCVYYSPISGSNSLVSMSRIPLCVVDWKGLLHIAKDASEIYIETSKVLTPADVGDDIFSSFKINWYVDYSQIITELCDKHLITTSPSVSYLANDKRKFKWKNEEYEVDCLGTSMHKILTFQIEEFYLKNKQKE